MTHEKCVPPKIYPCQKQIPPAQQSSKNGIKHSTTTEGLFFYAAKELTSFPTKPNGL